MLYLQAGPPPLSRAPIFHPDRACDDVRRGGSGKRELERSGGDLLIRPDGQDDAGSSRRTRTSLTAIWSRRPMTAASDSSASGDAQGQLVRTRCGTPGPARGARTGTASTIARRIASAGRLALTVARMSASGVMSSDTNAALTREPCRSMSLRRPFRFGAPVEGSKSAGSGSPDARGGESSPGARSRLRSEGRVHRGGRRGRRSSNGLGVARDVGLRRDSGSATNSISAAISARDHGGLLGRAGATDGRGSSRPLEITLDADAADHPAASRIRSACSEKRRSPTSVVNLSPFGRLAADSGVRALHGVRHPLDPPRARRISSSTRCRRSGRATALRGSSASREAEAPATRLPRTPPSGP